MNFWGCINRAPVSSLVARWPLSIVDCPWFQRGALRTATPFWYTSTVALGDNGPTLLLAGGGHAHLYSLLNTRFFAGCGVNVVLVNPSRFLYYSGMATGVISGDYPPVANRIDVRRLVERGGGSFVQGRVTGLRLRERAVTLEGGGAIRYDLASFCLGSEVPAVSGSGGFVIPVKPVENTVEVRNRILGHRAGSALRVLVVGGGAAGCEVAANAASLMARENVRGRVTLAEAGPILLESAPEKARRIIRRHLENRGVAVCLGTPIRSYGRGVVHTGDGRALEADLVVRAVGVVPRSVFRGLSPPVATGEDGGLWTNHFLQSISDPRVFGGGDSVSFRGEALPRLGVFGVRQGPVLFHNLLAALRGEPLREFKPQGRYLYVLNLGDGTGLAVYGPLAWRGRSAMKLKHAIDRRFVRRYGV